MKYPVINTSEFSKVEQRDLAPAELLIVLPTEKIFPRFVLVIWRYFWLFSPFSRSGKCQLKHDLRRVVDEELPQFDVGYDVGAPLQLIGETALALALKPGGDD